LHYFSNKSLFHFSFSRSCSLCSRKRKAEAAAMMPAKALKVGAILMMRMSADVAA
jgi:hypothetical protein